MIIIGLFSTRFKVNYVEQVDQIISLDFIILI